MVPRITTTQRNIFTRNEGVDAKVNRAPRTQHLEVLWVHARM